MSDISVVITVDEYNGGHPDFCVVNIHEPTHDTCSFSFNMEYLFEWVNNEHRALFLQDVFSKKTADAWNKDAIDIHWELVDFNEILAAMLKMWNRKTKSHKQKSP